MRSFIAGVRFRNSSQAPVDVGLFLVERFGSFSGSFDVVIGGCGGNRKSFLGFC